jgi:hypothetical protein
MRRGQAEKGTCELLILKVYVLHPGAILQLVFRVSLVLSHLEACLAPNGSVLQLQLFVAQSS